MTKTVIQIKRTKIHLRALTFLVCLFALSAASAVAAQAPDNNSVLILGSTATNANKSIEAYEAAQAGLTVVVASDKDWSAMIASDFASYRAIIFADGMCNGSGTLKAAITNQDVWGPMITGNVIVAGNHPGWSSMTTPSAQNFIQSGILFAASGQGTGAYISLGCYMSTSKAVDVPVLKPFGEFSVVQKNGCSSTSYLVASDPGLSALNDANMSEWDCSTDAEFASWDSSFVPLVVAPDASGRFVDPATGGTVSPYMLVRGAQVTALTTLQNAPSAPSLPSGNLPDVPGDPTVNVVFPMSGSQPNFHNGPVNLTTSDGKWGLTGNLTASLNWNPQSQVAVQWDSNLMHQGDTPGMVDTLDSGHGNLCVGLDISDLHAVLDGNSIDLPGQSSSVCGDCPLSTTGDPYQCKSGEQDIEIYCGGFGLVDACLWLTVTPTMYITPEAFSTDRTVLYDGTPQVGPDPLSFPPNPENDPLKLSCVAPVGSDVTYQLANPRTTAPVSNFGIDLGVAGGFEECAPIVGCAKQKVIDENDLSSIAIPDGGVTLGLSGPTGQVDVGQVQAENTIPDLTNVVMSYSGDEGSPITFSAAGAKDNCIDVANLVWNFSDHGVAYGFSPSHIFQDGGSYSGQLVVTNVGGNTATKSLTIAVNSLPPVVTAGPDTTAPWGVQVAFNGSATAPGADDQATLVYSWSFGDGTPSASGGASVSHAYSAPGNYSATLKVCDEDSLCASSTRQVVIRKRNVSLGYLGDQQGVYSTQTSLSSSLVDELGGAVPGRTVTFAIGVEAGGSAATNSSGLASTSHLIGLGAGTYTAAASFAGDTLYNAAAPSTATYIVNKDAVTVTYTGVLNGAPNKTVSLSAVLTDGQNRPLAGRLITFVLGAQTAAAMTDASGVAATTITMKQKNGSYPLTATFAPAAADANLYLGSVASATFKLQSK